MILRMMNCGIQKELSKLIDMATSVSAQLNVTNNPVHEEVEYELKEETYEN